MADSEGERVRCGFGHGPTPGLQVFLGSPMDLGDHLSGTRMFHVKRRAGSVLFPVDQQGYGLSLAGGGRGMDAVDVRQAGRCGSSKECLGNGLASCAKQGPCGQHDAG